MNIEEIMDNLSMWSVFFILITSILICTHIGFLLAKLDKRTPGRAIMRTGPIVTATLGLLAFMLAFTFGAVTSRENERKHLVLDEANAIGTAYLRASLLSDTDQTKSEHILNQYLGQRITAVQAGIAGELEHLTQAKKLQDELWIHAVGIADHNPTPITALYLQSLNEVFDMHQKRVTVGLHHRLPTIFWVALFCLTILTMTVGGYDSAINGGRRSITALLTVSLAFTVVLLLVIALDRPDHTVKQYALIELQKELSILK
jgi:hypothetical protein